MAGHLVAENHFDRCDFSGSYQKSVDIQDPTDTAIMVFGGCVFSNNILVGGAKWVALRGAVATDTATPISLSACYAFNATVVTGAKAVDSSSVNLS